MSTGTPRLDPRGLRFAAAVTAVVLALVLITAPSPLGVALLAAQTLVFGIGAFAGPQRSPYGWAFRTAVRPRLAPPAETEDPAAPRFAQLVGFAFAVVALAGYLSGATLLGAIATGLALGAAFLNAAFGFCLGCEVYLLARRLAPASKGVARGDARNTTPSAHHTAGQPPATTEVSA